MDRVELSKMTAEQLAERFAALTLAEAEARAVHDVAKSQQLRKELSDLENTLSERGEDGQKALLLLAGHCDEAVWLEAAAATLRTMNDVKIAPKYSRKLAKQANRILAKVTNAPSRDERETSSPS